MASTTFVNHQTVIDAAWLNDVNSAVYSGTFQASTITPTNITSSGAISGATVAGTTSVTTPIVKSGTSLTLQTNGSTTALTLDTSQNATFAGKVASASSLQLATNGTTTAVTIDTNQNVGIGTSSPACKADVNGMIRAQGSTVSASGEGLELIYTASTPYFGATNTAVVQAYNRNGSAFTSLVLSASQMAFATGGSERARIDTYGNLLVSQTSPNSTAVGVGIYNQGSNNWWNYICGNALDTTKAISVYSAGNGYRYFVNYNGGISNYQGNDSNLSDRREKTNFAPAKSYLDVICAIPVQTYNYIDQNLETDGGLTLGVIAQDVQAVAPELVTESNWGTKEEPKMRLSIYQTDMQYALMKCIQELSAQITTLQSQVTALQAKG